MTPHAAMIYNLLLDGQPHFSAEMRDKLGLLEYRRRVTELRRDGHNIESLKIEDPKSGFKRPAYQMTVFQKDLFAA